MENNLHTDFKDFLLLVFKLFSTLTRLLKTFLLMRACKWQPLKLVFPGVHPCGAHSSHAGIPASKNGKGIVTGNL